MPIREIGEAYGIVPMSSQMPHEHLIFWLRAAIRSGSDVKPGTCTVIGDNAVADAKAAGSPGSPRRKTWGACTIVMLKSYPLLGYGINCRGCRSFVSIASQVIWPQTVNIKTDNFHILSPRDVAGTVRSLSVVKKRKVFGTLMGIDTIYSILCSKYTQYIVVSLCFSTESFLAAYSSHIVYLIQDTRRKTHLESRLIPERILETEIPIEFSEKT